MLIIKRYANRKFYDTEEKRYITLEDISERIRNGHDIQVIDQSSGEEITSVVLSQIIFEQEKKRSGFIPRSVLAGLVQAGGFTMARMRHALANPLDLIKQIDEEISRRIDQLIKQGELAEEEGIRWREKLLKDLSKPDTDPLDDSEIRRLLDERGVPSSSELDLLSKQLDELMSKLEELETKSEGPQ